MANFDSGIKGYVKAEAKVVVYFPIDLNDNVEIACKHCPFYVRATQKCALNGAVLNYPEKFVGRECPLTQVEVEENV